MNRKPLVGVAVAALVVLLLLGLPTFVNLSTDWYWFQALNFETVFVTALATRLALGFVVGVVAFLFFFGNLRAAQRGIVPNPVVLQLAPNIPKVDFTHLLRRLTWPVSLVLGFLVGSSASAAWMVVLRFVNATPFGTADPIFGRDIGYYFFTLPVLTTTVGLIIGLTVVALFVTVPIYLLRGDIVVFHRKVTIEPTAEMHVGLLIATLLIGTAANVFFVRLPSLLFANNGALVGANYTDLHIRVPMMHVSWFVALAGAAYVLWGARNRKLVRNTVVAALAYFVVSGIAGTLAPAAFQKFVVAPNELARENPQLKAHIQATRDAWALGRVVTRDLSGEAMLSLEDIQQNAGTIKNVRLWDREPLLQTFGQLQEIRTYYDYVSVDDDRYWIDGEYRQVLLSPRELNTASLPNRNFINRRLTYTHGMGLTLGPVNQVSPEGLPVLFIKDLPPTSSVSLKVTRPEIYYGELSDTYAFVKTGQPEFDYPRGDSSAFTSYAGQGGVDVSSFFRRVLFSFRFGSKDILFTKYITDQSRILYHREIRERAREALPFLDWDSDPYVVITEDGRLKWILDAYTRSRRYPYSRPLSDGTNYMRNSVKVVIDAYDGDVKAYIADSQDPLIQTYAKIFKNIFLPLDSMTPDLRAHIRYPEDLFRAQTSLYTIYHMDDPEVFYSREDQWQIPAIGRSEGSRDPFLRHILMKLPGEPREEFIIMTPFTPRQKDNLTAWMVVRNDGQHYGELVVYRFPRQSLVFGPTQIVNRINQNTDISQQISLWDQRGSEVIRGNLLVIPINESLIFVQAIYLRAEGGRIPELKRVVVAYQNKVVMEETLEAGLARLFGGDVAGRSVTPTAARTPGRTQAGTDIAELIRQAAAHYDRAIEAQKSGDWATYGEEMRLVGELLRRLRNSGGGGGF
ncbi:MAG: UPF0182 family protein [Gemmatimonadales bacterium]